MSSVEDRPYTLVFVRHGQSLQNVVHEAAKHGDTRGFTDDFRNCPNSQFGLSQRGIEQALAAGEWIRANINGGRFDRYYVSPYRRALQTAGYLHLPEAEDHPVWSIKDDLREQSHGYFDGLTQQEQHQLFSEQLARKKIDGPYWEIPGGESFIQLCARAKWGIIATMHREVPAASAIAVAHGNLLWAIRRIMEGLTVDTYQALDNPANPSEKIYNCQILQYTRIDPNQPDHIAEKFSWMRSICPWKINLTDDSWKFINRPKYTNAQLLDS